MENILQPLIEELQNVKLEKQAYQKSLEVSVFFNMDHSIWFSIIWSIKCGLRTEVFGDFNL